MDREDREAHISMSASANSFRKAHERRAVRMAGASQEEPGPKFIFKVTFSLHVGCEFGPAEVEGFVRQALAPCFPQRVLDSVKAELVLGSPRKGASHAR